ncbi:hypothetical protein L218DRAFT_949211 [Marasmius fiardii PR-910]|nr:hypothetical protein L218DRAFT_949211 [Marasmius fiardii PR-910]
MLNIAAQQPGVFSVGWANPGLSLPTAQNSSPDLKPIKFYIFTRAGPGFGANPHYKTGWSSPLEPSPTQPSPARPNPSIKNTTSVSLHPSLPECTFVADFHGCCYLVNLVCLQWQGVVNLLPGSALADVDCGLKLTEHASWGVLIGGAENGWMRWPKARPTITGG